MKGRVNWGETTMVASFDRSDDVTALGMLVRIAEWLRTEAGDEFELLSIGFELLSITNLGDSWQVVWTRPKEVVR